MGLISLFLLRLARGLLFCRLHCNAADHRTVQAQIGQLAVRQRRQFVHGLAVHAVPGVTDLYRLNQ